ncbi:FAD-dependent thymidylate synthase [bacterium]|jgi:thymidylate synthase (FAD)|nr:FAD-dependent thymidylate synthase [bacterium]
MNPVETTSTPDTQNTNETESVKLIGLTPKAEEIIAYCARVSNPQNQDNPKISNLLTYCVKNGHWSIFEQASMVLEIVTSRGIAPQILRHRSFSFQEFSQRYAAANSYVGYQPRRQDLKNRQNSVDDLDTQTKDWFQQAQSEVWELAYTKYQQALEKGIAKECARFLLPLNTQTRLYMNGTVRSWIHYIELRTGHGTQLEHMQIANKCKQIFCEQLPTVAQSLGWLPPPAS